MSTIKSQLRHDILHRVQKRSPLPTWSWGPDSGGLWALHAGVTVEGHLLAASTWISRGTVVASAFSLDHFVESWLASIASGFAWAILDWKEDDHGG